MTSFGAYCEEIASDAIAGAEPVLTNIDPSTDADRSHEAVHSLTDGLAINLPPLSNAQVQQLSPAALAYLGDAVYELFVRRQYLYPPQRLHAYHQQVVSQVRAETQALHLATLNPHLTDLETEWVRKGRNAALTRSRRADAATYQQASGLETLIGYLYLTNFPRLAELLNLIDFTAATLH